MGQRACCVQIAGPEMFPLLFVASLQAIGGADPGPAELSGTDLTLLHIFKVLEGYMRCLPALGGEARFTAWQVLLQVRTDSHAGSECLSASAQLR